MMPVGILDFQVKLHDMHNLHDTNLHDTNMHELHLPAFRGLHNPELRVLACQRPGSEAAREAEKARQRGKTAVAQTVSTAIRF